MYRREDPLWILQDRGVPVDFSTPLDSPITFTLSLLSSKARTSESFLIGLYTLSTTLSYNFVSPRLELQSYLRREPIGG